MWTEERWPWAWIALPTIWPGTPSSTAPQPAASATVASRTSSTDKHFDFSGWNLPARHPPARRAKLEFPFPTATTPAREDLSPRLYLHYLAVVRTSGCLLYTSDAADDLLCVDL